LLYEQQRNIQKYWISHDKTYYDLFAEGAKGFNKSLDSLLTIQTEAAGEQMIYTIQRTHTWFVTSVVPFNSRAEKASKIKNVQDMQAMSTDSLEAIHGALNNLIRLNQASIDYSMTTVELITSRSSNVALILTLCTLFAAVTLAFVIARTITKPIGVLIRGTEQIAHGSFEPVSVLSHDEIALLTTAVNDMSGQLKKNQEHRVDLMHQIVHELRTPIQLIIAAHYTIKKKRAKLPPDADEQKMLDLIRSSVGQLTNFINQLLDIAKIETGMVVYDFQPTDLLPVLKPVIEHAKVIASQRQISVSFNAKTIPPVMADREKISQVVSNLLSNAIKYTQRGGTITILIARSDSNVQIAVADSGIGIPSEDIPKLFTKFYQATNASKASTKGTGLGLTLVKAFTEGHGGTVSVTSKVGEGTIFTINLPAVRENLKSNLQIGSGNNHNDTYADKSAAIKEESS
jgi:signal transduction histidine kinase